MKRPSHLEMAGWGLATMAGACVLAFKTSFGSGVIVLPVVLFCATVRVANDGVAGVRAALFLLVAVGLMWGPATGFSIDTRQSVPITTRVLPAVNGWANPAGAARPMLFAAGVWCGFVCAWAVRMALDRVSVVALIRATLAMAILLAAHLMLVSDGVEWEPNDAHVPRMTRETLVSVYSLMPVYAGYFVALFWDVAGRNRTVISTRAYGAE